MAGPPSPHGKFRWPPTPDAPPRDGNLERRPADEPTNRRRHPASVAWDQIESAWLDPRARSFGHRSRAQGWVADAPEMYCPRCASSVGPYEADTEGCAACRDDRLHWHMAVRLGTYDGLLKDAIVELKFSAWRRIGAELGSGLGEAVRQRLAQSEFSDRQIVFIPIPASYRRRIHRGIDHARILSESASKTCGGDHWRALRRKHRPEQWAVPPSQRAKNVSGVFRLRRLPPGEGQVVVLIDDVRTSGATMRAAARALRAGYRRAGRPLPAALVSAVVAVAGDHGRRSDGERPGSSAQGLLGAEEKARNLVS